MTTILFSKKNLLSYSKYLCLILACELEQPPDMNIKLSIPHDQRQIPLVGKTVSYLCVLCEVGEHPSVKNIELAIVELLNNIIVHGGGDCQSEIEVHCEFKGQEFAVSVTDNCRALSPEHVSAYTDKEVSMPSLDTGIDLLPEGGWGIQLIKSVYDQVFYTRFDQRNIYKLTFDLSVVEL